MHYACLTKVGIQKGVPLLKFFIRISVIIEMDYIFVDFIDA